MPFLLETAVQTLTIQGVVSNGSGKPKSKHNALRKGKSKPKPKMAPPISATLTRVSAPVDIVRPALNKIKHPNDAYYVLPEGEVPQRPVSTRPAPGTIQLTAILGERLGSGRTGIVFALENVTVDDPSVEVPKLVVKIARLNKLPSLSREAWFYDELEVLQGIAVPRCYGWFECEIGEPEGPGWADLHGQHRDHAVSLETRRGILHPTLAKQRDRRNVLSVLVLERLGGRLPLHTRISKEDRADILALYRDIGDRGVIIPEYDIRWQNILRMPTPPYPGLPSLPSPRGDMTHNFRLVDFDLARKSNFTEIGCRICHEPEAASTFQDIEMMWTIKDISSSESESEADGELESDE